MAADDIVDRRQPALFPGGRKNVLTEALPYAGSRPA